MGLEARVRMQEQPRRSRAGRRLALGLSACSSQHGADRSLAAQDKKRCSLRPTSLSMTMTRTRFIANGNAQFYYDNKVLEADKVIYDRAAKRVFAEGNVKMTDENGAVTYSTRLELTDNFRDGFIDSLRLESPTVVRGERLNVRFSRRAPNGTDGQTTTFALGTYTACEPCKDNPEKAAFWQVRAARSFTTPKRRLSITTTPRW